MAVAGEQPDADGISSRHKPVAVVLDFVQPVSAGRRTVGCRRQARLDEVQNGRHSGGYIAPALSGIDSVRTGIKDGVTGDRTDGGVALKKEKPSASRGLKSLQEFHC